MSTLSEQIGPIRNEIINLYQKRFELVTAWAKIAKSKIPADLTTPVNTNLISEQDFQNFDQHQMKITNYIVNLLSNPEVKKKIADLEKLETQINSKRAIYHTLANDTNAMIKKFNTGQAMIPTFFMERLVEKQKK